MAARAFESWVEVGSRVAEARESADLTQEALAASAGLERTALTKLELGRRGLSSLELARLAEVLERPIEWFVTESPPSVVSRRAEWSDNGAGLDAQVDTFARDVALLIELNVLQRHEMGQSRVSQSLDEAEALAVAARSEIDQPNGPVLNLMGMIDRFGLHVASLDLGEHLPDGAYVALDGAGAAIINGSHDPGRRRFTLVHELGHHLMADEYATDWAIGDTRDDHESRINAFAIHFLMPRHSVRRNWAEYQGDTEPRSAATRLAVEYRLSWTAVCSHLQNLRLIDQRTANELRNRAPTRSDFLELGLFIVPELTSPAVSCDFARAALRAYRAQKITAGRTIELLRGTITEDDLPPVDVVPLSALRNAVVASE